jgi:hypothetical protein
VSDKYNGIILLNSGDGVVLNTKKQIYVGMTICTNPLFGLVSKLMFPLQPEYGFPHFEVHFRFYLVFSCPDAVIHIVYL